MNTRTQRLLVGLLLTLFFAACSRPVAYFQPSQRESFTKTTTTTAPVIATEAPTATPAEAIAVTPSPAEQVAQANAALDQMEAVVRNDAKLSTDKSVQKRLNRVRNLLASAAEKGTLTPTATTAPHKMNLVERMMVKKMNKKINRQLAPNNPEKAMANTGILAAGAVAVIIGLLILLLGGSGTLGVILLLAGAIVLVVGLLT